jgi:thioredoxin-related protein
MISHRVPPLCLALALALTLCSCNSHKPNLDYFTADYDGALSRAKSENKLVMVDLYADWCGPCQAMDADVFNHDGVRKLLTNHFVSVKIDVDKGGRNAELANKFGTRSIPHIVFLDATGQRLQEFKGYVPASEFVAVLETLRKSGPHPVTP